MAKIVERVSGMPFPDFVRDRLLLPLGLKSTHVVWKSEDTNLPAPFLKGYSSGGEGFFETTEDNMSGQVGPGSIVSTPHDMAVWIRALLSGNGPLSLSQVRRMTTIPEGNTTYALGTGKNAVGLGHSGAHPGYVNLVTYDPESGAAVVVVTPFIDYTKLEDHLALLTEIGLRAKAAATGGAEARGR